MREPLPESERQKDLEALLTLPEFVKEPLPAHIHHSYLEREKEKILDKRKRDRSVSAPPLAWLRPTSSRGSSTSSFGSSNSLKGKSKALQANGEIFHFFESSLNLLKLFVMQGLKSCMLLRIMKISIISSCSSQ